MIATAIGEASYSISLLHSDLFPFFTLAPESTVTQRVVNVILFLAALAIASWATHRYVEMPAKLFIMSIYRRIKPGNSTTKPA